MNKERDTFRIRQYLRNIVRDVASEDEIAIPCEDEEVLSRVTDFMKMIVLPSEIVLHAAKIVEDTLKSIGIVDVSTIIVNSISSIFFAYGEQKCSVVIRHHSLKSVLVYICRNDVLVGQMFMWLPLQFQWHILYLIAGYYKIKEAVIKLHEINSVYCLIDNKTHICAICKKSRAEDKSDVKIKYKLELQYDD